MGIRLKSTKTVKTFEEISLPLILEFPVSIEGGVNGRMFNFPANQEVEVSFSQYEVIFNSDYGKYLRR